MRSVGDGWMDCIDQVLDIQVMVSSDTISIVDL